MPDLLIELFSEEIPARMQARARNDLRRLITDGLVAAGLTYRGAQAHSTPRRLALAIDGLAAQSPERIEERKGPRTDAPEAAIDGFLRATGLQRGDLVVRAEKKGEAFFATIRHPGRPAAEIVAEVLEGAIRNFPWPKSMRWGAGSLRWVRPLHSILCILTDEGGANVVPLVLDGLRAGNTTQGHRFMAPERFSVTSFDDYAAKLRRAHVMLDADERAAAIWQEAGNQAFARGLDLVEDRGLLAEVAGLVEWPVVLLGDIGADFRDLPPEVLQTSMREHQKFFSLRDPKSAQIVGFVTVANIVTADHGATILAGNGRVLAARLGDAKFFWQNDLRTVANVGLEGMAAGLKDVTFHAKLGSQAERVARIEALAREIAPLVGAAPDLAAEAARVAKADLQSEMVGEFPELQGVMGRYYAKAAGHDDGVPEACEDHYKPLGPGDTVPSDPVTVAVALADKIDTLTGFWAIDEKPTGSKDPYALRRAALGVIRLVLGNGLRIDLTNGLLIAGRRSMASMLCRAVEVGQNSIKLPLLKALGIAKGDSSIEELNKKSLEAADLLAKGFGSGVPPQSWEVERSNDLLAFLHDRLKVHLREQGIRHDVIDACLAMPGNDDLTLLVKRAEALAAFLKTDDGENLLQGFKRANNILTQAEEKDGVEYSYGPDPKLAEGPEEKALFTALDAAEAVIAPAMKAEDFTGAMAAMADLRAPLDAFFNAVQVNTDNAIIRRNRLNLLHRIRAICLSVADLTRLDG
ncbi:glycyl-tRNA synthetase beta chain [Rhodobacteraceae bacterium MBR-64]